MNIRDAVETDLPAIVAITMPRFPAAQQQRLRAGVESRLFWFHERHLPSYRPIWVMSKLTQHLRQGIAG